MKYVYGEGVSETKSYTKRLAIGLTAVAVSVAMSVGLALSASAHGVGGIVAEDNPNCYGKVASLHAKDGKGLKASYEEWNHVGVGLDGSETFQEEVAALKEACRAE